MCASTFLRILRGVLAAGMFFIAGKDFLTSGFTAPPVLLALLGVWLAWQAITGVG